MAKPLGLNVLGDRGRNAADVVRLASMMDAGYHVVMNNAALAQALVSGTKAKIIYRDHDQDDNAQDRTNAREFVRKRHAAAPFGSLIYLGNEPYPTQRLADWTMEAMDECDKLGRKAVVLNFPTGNPEPANWTKFKTVLGYAYDHGHVLGLHEYANRYWRNDYKWHVERWEVLKGVMGSRLPKIVITETGCCVDYQPYRGYRWANTLTDDQYAGDLNSMAQYYADNGIYACIFALTSENPADDWNTFNPSEKVIGLVAATNIVVKTPQPTPDPEPEPCDFISGRITKTAVGEVYVRKDPSTTSAILKVMKTGDTVMFCEKTITRGNYTWWRIESGYIAETNLATGVAVCKIERAAASTPFRLKMPLEWAYVITSRFGEPRDYDGDGKKDDKHEGLDFAPTLDVKYRNTLEVLAAADGVVESVRDFGSAKSSGTMYAGYGMYVRLTHTHEGQVWKTWYGHLGVPLVWVGKEVNQGDVIGLAGTSGNSTGTHLHFTVQKIGGGLSGYEVADVVDPYPLIDDVH